MASTVASTRNPSAKVKELDPTKHPWLRLHKETFTKNRKALSENYDNPVTEREGWWRTYIRETPLPGSYKPENYLGDLQRKPNTYRFKSDGRKMDAHPHGKGAVLMPGAYQHHDFLESLEKLPASYNFKAIARDGFDAMNFGRKDRDINVSPDKYGLQDYLTVSAGEKQPSKHSMFKSSSKRFPTRQFVPRIGPAPGAYEETKHPAHHAVSSSFKSKTPRFHSSHTRVPGPGSYEKTFQFPMSDNIANMGRQHGLFFTSAFQG